MQFNPSTIVFNLSSKIKGEAFSPARLLLFIVSLAFMSGCATSSYTQDESLLLVSVKSGKEINPDVNQRPSPVELHIYLLKSPSLFLEQDYYSLVDHPDQALKQDLIHKESMIIRPDRIEREVFKVDNDYGYIGIIVSFRDLDGSEWRDVARQPEKGIVSAMWPERWKFGKNKWYLNISINEREAKISSRLK